MSKSNKQPKMNIHEEYWQYHEKYQGKYGSKVVVLMAVGSFHEAYSTNERGPNLFQLSDLLNIVVTRKDKSISVIDEKNPYMLGFPSHSISKFLKILIDNSYTVVVIDQVTPPPNPARAVTGVYSPGTFIDTVTVENKYLMILYIEVNTSLNSTKSNISIGMSAVDTSTGQVIYYESHGSGIIDENESLEEAQRFYHYFRPIELIVYQIDNTNNDLKQKIIEKIDIIPNQTMLTYNKINPAFTKLSYQNTQLKKVYPQCGMETPIEFLDLSKYPYAIISMISSFDYIFQHNENLLKELKIPKYFDEHKYMILGNNAQYQLNIVDYYNWDKIDTKFHSLNSVINNCATPMGKRVLRNRLCAPYTDTKTINELYNLTEKILKLNLWEETRSYLKGVSDLDKLFRKISIKVIQPYELYSVYDSFGNIVKIFELLMKSEFKTNILTMFDKKDIKKFNSAVSYLENTFQIEKLKINNLIEIKESFYVKDIHPEIDELEDKISNGIGLIEKLASTLEKYDANLTLSIKHNDRDGYYLNTTKLRGKKLQELLEKEHKTEIKLTDGKIIKVSDLVFTYQTTTSKITYKGLSDHSDEIDELYNQLGVKVKTAFYEDVHKWYFEYSSLFLKLIGTISQIDLITNNAFTSVKYHYVKPTIISDKESQIYAEEMRHPIIERIIDYEYVPHDVELDNDTNGNLIYGCNAVGKSSYMKAIGLNLIMAQCGLYVAATKFEYGIFDSLYTRISGNDNLFKGHSSFIVEMNELRTILKKANSKTLIIGDEICRGTEYLSANAIVASAIIKLIEMKSKFLFATHLHDLVKIEKIKNLDSLRFFHLSVEKKGDEIIFNRKLSEGTGEQIYGITIAKYILDDPIFINSAIELKNELLEKADQKNKLVSDKKSLYNKDIYMDACSVCGGSEKLESHHINWQKDFKSGINGLINSKKPHLLKDSQANLIVLCYKCHDELHDSKISISGKVKSTNGIKIT
jgi:DNA mismatch repair protein MutS